MVIIDGEIVCLQCTPCIKDPTEIIAEFPGAIFFQTRRCAQRSYDTILNVGIISGEI